MTDAPQRPFLERAALWLAERYARAGVRHDDRMKQKAERLRAWANNRRALRDLRRLDRVRR